MLPSVVFIPRLKLEENAMCCKINLKAFALSLGIVWGVGMFLTGILAMLCGFGTAFVDLFATVYVGFAATFVGSLIGGFWGFVDAAIGGFIFGWLYNRFAVKKEE